MSRFLAALAMLVLLGSEASRAGAQELGELAGAKQICESGPASQRARAERLSGAAQVAAADVLPNPSLVAEHQRSLSGATDHETIVGVSLPLSIGGRRSLLRDAAHARSEQATFVASSTLFESALQFRQAYAAAIIDRARVVALTEQQTSLDALSATIAALAQGGEAAQYDLLRQRVHARLHRRALDIAKARASGSLMLVEAWLGSTASLPATPALELAGGALGDARPVDGVAAKHPALQGLEADARASAFEARAARRRWVPELELFAGYRAATAAGDTGHGLALSLSVPLTFFDHGQGEAALASARQARASAEQEQLRHRYTARLQAADAQLAALSQGAAELETARAEATTLLDKTRQLYAAGEASLTELLDAFRVAEEAQLAVIELAEELVAARLARMQAAGTQLDEALDKACSGNERSGS